MVLVVWLLALTLQVPNTRAPSRVSPIVSQVTPSIILVDQVAAGFEDMAEDITKLLVGLPAEAIATFSLTTCEKDMAQTASDCLQFCQVNGMTSLKAVWENNLQSGFCRQAPSPVTVNAISKVLRSTFDVRRSRSAYARSPPPTPASDAQPVRRLSRSLPPVSSPPLSP